MKQEYSSDYFKEGIFDTDYENLSEVIYNTYKPKTIIEFGCGTGKLVNALSKFDVTILAIDGFSKPDLNGAKNISFSLVDLNDENAIEKFIGNRVFDIAICTEVAEHLAPQSSEFLVKYLTRCTKTIIFSAAVPDQLGHGHINCRSRFYWHLLFTSHGFNLLDSLRGQIRDNKNMAIWYKLNLLDYQFGDIDKEKAISNLVASESYSSSLFYKSQNKNEQNLAYLNYPLVKQYFQLRGVLKKIFRNN